MTKGPVALPASLKKTLNAEFAERPNIVPPLETIRQTFDGDSGSTKKEAASKKSKAKKDSKATLKVLLGLRITEEDYALLIEIGGQFGQPTAVARKVLEDWLAVERKRRAKG